MIACGESESRTLTDILVRPSDNEVNSGVMYVPESHLFLEVTERVGYAEVLRLHFRFERHGKYEVDGIRSAHCRVVQDARRACGQLRLAPRQSNINT